MTSEELAVTMLYIIICQDYALSVGQQYSVTTFYVISTCLSTNNNTHAHECSKYSNAASNEGVLLWIYLHIIFLNMLRGNIREQLVCIIICGDRRIPEIY